MITCPPSASAASSLPAAHGLCRPHVPAASPQHRSSAHGGAAFPPGDQRPCSTDAGTGQLEPSWEPCLPPAPRPSSSSEAPRTCAAPAPRRLSASSVGCSSTCPRCHLPPSFPLPHPEGDRGFLRQPCTPGSLSHLSSKAYVAPFTRNPRFT